MSGLNQELCKFKEIIKKSILIEDGNPARYRLQIRRDNLDQSEPYRKMTFGARDRQKPHKSILMVGETGSGKTTLINAMINYMLDVKREDKVWFEITDDQSDRTSVYSQTSSITVYEFYSQESGYDLTIIDTPGYGDTPDNKNNKEICISLLSLSKSTEAIQKIDAVCLVIDASQNRLSDRQQYIFDSVQSLFGRDIAENIVLLLTHSTGTSPKNALMAVKEAEIKCAVNEQNQPVYFKFNNCQSEAADEEYKKMQEHAWDLSFNGMIGFFTFLDNIQPKTLRMSQDVLCQQELEANISNLKKCVRRLEKNLNKLKQTQEALKQNEEYVRNNKNFEYEVEVVHKEKVDIIPPVVKVVTCTICKENCPHPDGWFKTWYTLTKEDHCKMCKNNCHQNQHLKEAKIYVTMTKKEKRINEELKNKHDGEIRDAACLVKQLEEELQQLANEKIKHAFDAFYCVKTQMITLNICSPITLKHIDFLIDTLKELNEPKKAETLENIKTAGREKSLSTGKHKRLNEEIL